MAMTAKLRRFVDEFIVDLNATQAAIRAGYSARTAHSIGYENLRKPEVRDAIEAAQKARQARVHVTQDRVLEELARVAFFDPRKLFGADGAPKPITELDDATAAAVAGLEVLEEFEGSGDDRVFVGYTKKYKISGKVEALSLAMRHLGMLKDKLAVEQTLTDLTDEQLDAKLAAIEKAKSAEPRAEA